MCMERLKIVESSYHETGSLINMAIIKLETVFLLSDMIVTILWRLPPEKQRLRLLLLGITKRYITNASPAPADPFIRQCYS